MSRLSPASRITLSLVVIVYGSLLLAKQLSLFPNEGELQLSRKTALCETLAVSCSIHAQRNDTLSLEQTLDLAINRNSDIRSIALRRDDGQILQSAGNHGKHWTLEEHAASTRDNVVIPILTGTGAVWGQLEVSFVRSDKTAFIEIFSSNSILHGVFICALSSLLFLVYMDRTLQYLDPTQAVPGRVRSALNTLAEGLIVLDKHNRIVLANEAFGKHVGATTESLVGRNVKEIPWLGCLAGEILPWEQSIKSGKAEVGARIRLADGGKDRTFLVNASPVIDDNGQRQGILASFDDITALEEKKTNLQKMLADLRESRERIKRQNEELKLLATIDPLTGCFNRRTFLTRFDDLFMDAEREGTTLHCMMVDIDYFKSVNDNFGHSAGDEVLRVVAGILRQHVTTNDMACRYGGEEFCLLMPGRTQTQINEEAETIRDAIENTEIVGLPIKVSVTASLGLSSITDGAQDPQELQDQADKSLYVAKRNGRNQVITWNSWPEGIDFDDEIPREMEAPESSSRIPYPAVTALLSALAYRDPETAAHSKRVSELCVEVARGLMSAREIYVLEIAALLHDIGKIGVPDAILLKPGPLTTEEWKIMHTHDRISVDIVDSAFHVPELSAIINLHHTRFSHDVDDAPSGEDIPIGARIVTLADAFDAMVSDRVYRKGMSNEKAFEELRRCAGGQFDPQLVERLIAVVNSRPPSHQLAVTSKDAALQIGIQVEQLMAALDEHDIPRLNKLASRLNATAASHLIPEMQTLTNELIAASQEEDPELRSLGKITEQLIDLCRSTRTMYVEARDRHSQESNSIEPG